MADIIIPGTNKVLLDGTILMLPNFDDVEYIIHQGFYEYNHEVFNGWYGVSIPDQQVIPIVQDMLVGCEVIHYPDSNCGCRYPSGNIPYTTEDDYQVQRSFITVDTMIERDALAPTLSVSDLPSGRIVRVNKPNNVDYDPKYYVYRYNSDLSAGYWEQFIFYSFPVGGIPESDLSQDVQDKLDSIPAVEQKIDEHIADTGIHVTQAQKDSWNRRNIVTIVGNSLVISELDTPVIVINGNIVSWSPIYNATRYTIFANGEDVGTVDGLVVDLNNLLFTSGVYGIEVVAKSDIYGWSAPSNIVVYSKASEVQQLSLFQSVEGGNDGNR